MKIVDFFLLKVMGCERFRHIFCVEFLSARKEFYGFRWKFRWSFGCSEVIDIRIGFKSNEINASMTVDTNKPIKAFLNFQLKSDLWLTHPKIFFQNTRQRTKEQWKCRHYDKKNFFIHLFLLFLFYFFLTSKRSFRGNNVILNRVHC